VPGAARDQGGPPSSAAAAAVTLRRPLSMATDNRQGNVRFAARQVSVPVGRTAGGPRAAAPLTVGRGDGAAGRPLLGPGPPLLGGAGGVPVAGLWR
jgi:hypothetical protein